MIWWRIASTGTPPERYTLQVPFDLAPGLAFKTTESEPHELRGLHLEILENQGIYLARVTGFSSAEEAEGYFPKLRGALLRFVACQKAGVWSPSTLQAVRTCEPPTDLRESPSFKELSISHNWTHLDGYVDPSPGVVIPEHLRIVEVRAGSVTVTLTKLSSWFTEHIAESLLLPGIDELPKDEKLCLAIELYGASHWEQSKRARVVQLATCLEVLSPSETVCDYTAQVVDSLISQLEAMESATEDSIQKSRLSRLRDRTRNLKSESISAGLRAMAEKHAPLIGESAEDARRNMMSAYDVRSTLVHNGHAPRDEVDAAECWLAEAAPIILQATADELISAARTKH